MDTLDAMHAQRLKDEHNLSAKAKRPEDNPTARWSESDAAFWRELREAAGYVDTGTDSL